MNAATMWVVTRGEYSDYRVLCVCDSKERAEAIAAIRDGDSGYDEPSVEALPYFDRMPKRITTYQHQVTIWDNGTTTDARESQRTEWEHDLMYPEHLRPVAWRWVRAPMHKDKGGRLEVFGTSRTRVRKVLSDKRAELIATDSLRNRREITS